MELEKLRRQLEQEEEEKKKNITGDRAEENYKKYLKQ